MTTEPRAGSVLVTQVRDHSRMVIDSELRRLAGRARALRQSDLNTIDAALDDLVESLILARIRALPQHTERIGTLFGTSAPPAPDR